MKKFTKFLKEAEIKQPSVADKTRERQEREKEQMRANHERQMSQARQQDFRQKEMERKRAEQQKSAEKLASKKESIQFGENFDEIYEYLEDGTYELVNAYKKSLPGQS